MARHPVLLPCLLLAVQTIPALWAKDVWFSDEARHAAVLLQLVEHGHWLVLHLGDGFYPDKPPLYFWLLAAIAYVLNSTEPVIFMVGAAISAFAFLIATVRAAGGFGFHRTTALLAGLLLVGNYYFISRAHFPRMDLLFATFILLSHVSFYRAVMAKRTSIVWSTTAFFLAALATLTKGPVGFLLPFAGLLVFLAFERRLKDLFSRAMMIGSLAFLIPMALYLLGVYSVAGREFIEAILIDQTLQRAVATPRLAGPVYYYLHKLPEIFLPWSLLIFFLPWRAIVTGRSGGPALTGQPSGSGGLRYLLIIAVTSLLIISSFDYKITFLLITLLPQVAILCALLIGHMPHRRRRWLFSAIVLLYAGATAAIPFAGQLTLWPDHVHGEGIVALSMLPVIAGMVWAARRSALVFCTIAALGATIVSLPYYLITVRGLDAVMSTRELGTYLGRVAENDQSAVYYHPFRAGIFDYHAGTVIPYLDDLKGIDERMRRNPCGVFAMRASDWARWDAKPAGLTIIAERRLDYETYVLVRWGTGSCRLPDLALPFPV